MSIDISAGLVVIDRHKANNLKTSRNLNENI